MTAPIDISPASISHDEATKASFIRDPDLMWAYVEELRLQLTASESRASLLWEALNIVFNDDSGDIDFIMFKIRQFLPGEKF